MKVKEKAVNFYLWEHVNACASPKASPFIPVGDDLKGEDAESLMNATTRD
jgi:hypothetical protein